jgi:hypothetical protein
MKASGQKSAASYHYLAWQTKLEGREDVGNEIKLCTCDSGIGYERMCTRQSNSGSLHKSTTPKIGSKKRPVLSESS